ncbi:unnamed protein product [Callosobruchus maculatus]|uniref:LRRNT domain-containing protein n=1 Tax=Callosobruchus maculatus TaxID=64391 RepID=A0A653CU01_CALMS|nr:unnamed protein product [Callosobruchus maculatus]
MLYMYFIVYCFLISPTLSLLPEDDSSCYHRCFHQPAAACPPPGSLCRCRQLPNCKRAAVCCDVNKFTLTEGLGCGNISSDGLVEALHIRNATLDVLNITHPVWRRLRFMTITDGQIKQVVGEFAKHTIVSCLNLSSNGIQKFEPRSLVNLFNLSYLDLSDNNLTDVPRFKMEGAVTLDISQNPSMLCSSVKDILSRPEISFNNENSTTCSSAKTFQWFNSTEFLAISQLKLLHELEKNCFGKCTCEPYRLDMVMGKSPTFAVEVNCSGVKFENKLTSLPTPLPPRTVLLDISNNNIETYLLSNIKFYRTAEPRHIKLGLNKLHCDCQTAMEFKVWLLTKIHRVPDYNEIICENINAKVVELDQTKLCQGEQDWTDYIYYIITAEVLLLVGLIAKVSYDYWVFKTAGYLPWPASKMPKLPCDWLCE